MHIVPIRLVNQMLEEMPASLHTYLENGADLLISVSGGADSDGMTYLIREAQRLRCWTGQFRLVHADLGRLDWPQTGPHVNALAQRVSLDIDIVRRQQGDLLDSWHQRYETMRAKGQDAIPFSSAKARFCTSYHKRDVLAAHARRFTPTGMVISAQGIRKQESSARAGYEALSANENLTTRVRQAYNWYPIFTFSREEVWEACGTNSECLAMLRIQAERLREVQTIEQIVAWISTTDWPCHPSYVLGADRLSCCLCILANRQTLEAGAHGNPDIYRQVVDLEILSGKSFQPNRWLSSLRPDLLRDDQREALQQIVGATLITNAPHQLPLL
jgi:3'-phosphoadenosine 5'-phosphosulfate sulfotransferase (PAPS reductase)/FAD synthetase